MSGSMSAPFGSSTRFEAATSSARNFCEYREGDAFGLTVFGSEFLHWLPPTKELSAIQNAMSFLEPARRLPWFGGTMIGRALRGCKERLARTQEGDRAIILITDGGSADFQNGGDRQIAEELAKENIRVLTIMIGGGFVTEGVYTIASYTSGKVFEADDPTALTSVFR